MGTSVISGSDFIGNPWQDLPNSLQDITLDPIPTSKALYRGDGLLFLREGGLGYTTYYIGSLPITGSLRLYPANNTGLMTSSFGNHNQSGLTFVDGDYISPIPDEISPSILTAGGFAPSAQYGTNWRLALTQSLAGTGLEFPSYLGNTISTDQITITLTGSSNGDSGLKLGVNGLAISDNLFDSDDFIQEGGSGSIKEYTNGGIIISTNHSPEQTLFGDNKVVLTGSLAGIGLNFSSQRSILNIDPSYIITQSADSRIRLKVNSSPKTLAVGNTLAGGLFDSIVDVLYDNTSNVAYLGFEGDGLGLGTFISKKILFTGSIFQSGSSIFPNLNNSVFTITGSSLHVRSNHLGILDYYFLTLNSGSPDEYPWSSGSGGILANTTTSDYSGSGFFFKKNTGDSPTFFSDIISSGSWYISSQSSIPYEAHTIPDTSPTFSYNSDTYRTVGLAKMGTLTPNEGNNTYPAVYGARFMITSSTNQVGPWSNVQFLAGTSSIIPGNATTTTDGATVTLQCPFITTGSGGDIPSDAVIKGYRFLFQASVSDISKPVVAYMKTRMINAATPFQTVFTKSIDVTSGGSPGTLSSNFYTGGPDSLFNLTSDPNELHKVAVQVYIPDANSNTFRLYYFSGSDSSNTYNVPRVQVYYNTREQEDSLFKDENAFDKYGTIYVNTGSGDVYMYVPE
jgi:hypothetical protein